MTERDFGMIFLGAGVMLLFVLGVVVTVLSERRKVAVPRFAFPNFTPLRMPRKRRPIRAERRR